MNFHEIAITHNPRAVGMWMWILSDVSDVFLVTLLSSSGAEHSVPAKHDYSHPQ